MVMCNSDQAIEVAMDVTVQETAAAAGIQWTYAADPNNPPTVTVQPNGDLDFSASGQPVHVTIRLHTNKPDPDLVFFVDTSGTPFGFADSYDDGYTGVHPVGPGHQQFSNVTVGNGGHSVSFCYANRTRPGEAGNPNHYKRSRYTLRLGDGVSGYARYLVDPQINNH
jgi:hypothetical protein